MEQDTRDTSADLEAYFAKGGSMRELFQIEREKLDILYAFACQRYDAGDYEGAREVYFSLVAIDANCFEYWLATGLCSQQLQRHDEAIYCFSRSGQLRLEDPRSSYLAGVSFQVLGETKRAVMAYSSAIKWCAAHAEHRELRAQATQSLNVLAMGEG